MFISHFSRSSFIELLNDNKIDEIFDKLINPIQEEINEFIINEKAALKKWIAINEKIRKSAGLKEEEYYFDGRNGIRRTKQS